MMTRVFSFFLLLMLTAHARADYDTLFKQVEELYGTGRAAQAIPLAEKLVVEAERKFGPESVQTAAALSYLGICHKAAGSARLGLAPLQRALAIYEKNPGPESPHTSAALNNLGDCHRALGETDRAIHLLLRAQAISQKLRGLENLDTANIMANLGIAYYLQGDLVESEEWTRKALVVQVKLLGPEALPTIHSRQWLGRALSGLHTIQPGEAEASLLKALAGYEKLLGPTHPDTIETLMALASLYSNAGALDKAELYLRRCVSACEKQLGPEHDSTLVAQNELGRLLSIRGDFAGALELQQKVLAIRERKLGPDHREVALCLNNLAMSYREMAIYDKAEPLFLRAVAIADKYPGWIQTATFLTNLADLYCEAGALLRAQPCYLRALEQREKIRGPRHPEVARSLSAVGQLYYADRQPLKAEPFFLRALSICEEAFGPSHVRTASAMTDLGLNYQMKGEAALALHFLEQGLAIKEKALGPRHPHLTPNLTSLAEWKVRQGDPAGAEPLAERAMEISQASSGPDHEATTRAIEALFLIELELGKGGRALELARLAQAGNDRRLATMLAYTSERRRLEYTVRTNPYSGPIMTDNPTDIALALLRHKALVLDSLLEDAQAAQRNPASRAVLAKLAAARERYLAQPPGPGRDQVGLEVERLEGELAIGRSRRALSITLEQVQAAIPPEAVLVEFIYYEHYLGRAKLEKRYGACLIPPKGLPVWVELGTKSQIDEALKLGRRNMMRNPGSLEANLKALYGLLWAPVAAKLLPGTRRVILSPYGELSFLSFATLLTPEDKFLGEQLEISYVGTGRDLLRPSQAAAKGSLVLVGDANFSSAITAPLQAAANRDILADDVRGLKLGPLPGTARECETLAVWAKTVGWPVERFEKERASEASVRAVKSPFVLHLATHGFFLNESKEQALVNPMRRSGLALTGAESTLTAWEAGKFPAAEQDGILTAEEVGALDLSRTWLVTLSACDTGRGEAVPGEGVMGLRRGFVQAGAANLMLTLWRVSDQFAVPFMSDFYRVAQESGSPTRALSQVQATWLVKLRQENGLAEAVQLAGPFVMTFQGKP